MDEKFKNENELVDFLASKSWRQLREIQGRIEEKEKGHANTQLIPESLNEIEISKTLETELQWLDRRLREVYEWAGLNPKIHDTLKLLYD